MRAMKRAPPATANPRSPPCVPAGPSWSFWISGCRDPSWTAFRCWILKREQPDLPMVMISGHGTIETAVASIKKGAYDFIEKPFKADRLIHVVNRALESARLKREVQELKLK